jgi:hypothetical protein
MNPFNQLNNIVIQLTVRMGSCHELADDPKAVARLSHLLDVVEENSTPASLLLPWFPSPARRARNAALHDLSAMMGSYVEMRRTASVRTSETIDFLLDAGCNPESITQVSPLVSVDQLSHWSSTVCPLPHPCRVHQHWDER